MRVLSGEKLDGGNMILADRRDMLVKVEIGVECDV